MRVSRGMVERAFAHRADVEHTQVGESIDFCDKEHGASRLRASTVVARRDDGRRVTFLKTRARRLTEIESQ
jgi:hypothetical protein